MKKLMGIALFVFGALLVVDCSEKTKQDQNGTMTEGKINILVDESLLPIIEDEVEIFESTYDAKITLEPKSEAEVIQALVKDSSRVAILARDLSVQEENSFTAKKIIPKRTKFATDAIAFISNKSSNDTLIDLQDVINFMQQKSNSKIKGLVFDNPNSSTARYINELSGITAFPAKGVFSFKTNDEVIKYVSQNKDMIGIVGLNWLDNPKPEMRTYIDKLNVLSVKGKSSNSYNFPSQNNIAEGKYPLARDLYVVNCETYPGLGKGISLFVADEIGQRIILKSGLVPIKTPGRKLHIRNGIENNKK